MEVSKFFTPEEEEILIDLISEYPPLYSHKDEAFKDKEFKATIWKKIADSLGKNEEVCKTKWKNLRDYYNKKKRIATLANSSGTSNNSRKYDRYLRMKFLEGEEPRSSSNADAATISEEENTQEDYEHPSMREISLECDQTVSISPDDTDGVLEDSPQPYKKAKTNSNQRSPHQRLLMEYIQASGERMDMEEMQSSKNIIVYDDSNETPPYATFASTGDPLEDFFRGIITTVKSFSPRLQLQAKRSISNIVFDLEQEALSSKANIPDSQTNSSR